MTWKHHKHRTKNGLLHREWYFADLGIVSILIVWDRDLPYWKLTLSWRGDDFDDLTNRHFDTADDAMFEVEQRLASKVQDLLLDVLGKRRIQEAK